MGYRSDVAYCIRFQDVDTANRFIAVMMAKGGDEADALKQCTVNILASGEVDIGYYDSYVKWYPEDPIVSGHENLLAYVETAFDGGEAAYEFYRLGEDHDDLEVRRGRGFRDWLVQVIRELRPQFAYGNPIGDALKILDKPTNNNI